MRPRVFLVSMFALVFAAVASTAGTAAVLPIGAGHTAAASASGTAGSAPVPPTTSIVSTRPPLTVNEFLPEDRGLGECISAIPKPGCGSDARGGWRQGLVLLTILVGLTLIAWRVIVGARRSRREQPTAPS